LETLKINNIDPNVLNSKLAQLHTYDDLTSTINNSIEQIKKFGYKKLLNNEQKKDLSSKLNDIDNSLKGFENVDMDKLSKKVNDANPSDIKKLSKKENKYNALQSKIINATDNKILKLSKNSELLSVKSQENIQILSNLNSQNDGLKEEAQKASTLLSKANEIEKCKDIDEKNIKKYNNLSTQISILNLSIFNDEFNLKNRQSKLDLESINLASEKQSLNTLEQNCKNSFERVKRFEDKYPNKEVDDSKINETTSAINSAYTEYEKANKHFEMRDIFIAQNVALEKQNRGTYHKFRVVKNVHNYTSEPAYKK
jgi:hypothetical protein